MTGHNEEGAEHHPPCTHTRGASPGKPPRLRYEQTLLSPAAFAWQDCAFLYSPGPEWLRPQQDGHRIELLLLFGMHIWDCLTRDTTTMIRTRVQPQHICYITMSIDTFSRHTLDTPLRLYSLLSLHFRSPFIPCLLVPRIRSLTIPESPNLTTHPSTPSDPPVRHDPLRHRNLHHPPHFFFLGFRRNAASACFLSIRRAEVLCRGRCGFGFGPDGFLLQGVLHGLRSTDHGGLVCQLRVDAGSMTNVPGYWALV